MQQEGWMDPEKMNYSKNLRRVALVRRVIILMCIAFIIGMVIGGIGGYALKTYSVVQSSEQEGGEEDAKSSVGFRT